MIGEVTASFRITTAVNQNFVRHKAANTWDEGEGRASTNCSQTKTTQLTLVKFSIKQNVP